MPSLPVMYFASSASNSATPPVTDPQIATPRTFNDLTTLHSLPPELAHKCLAEYADWGTLAKLACVQKEWSTIVLDAAGIDYNSGSSEKLDEAWELAQALINGTHGLQVNNVQGMKLLHYLSGIKVNPETMMPESSSPEAADRDSNGADDADETTENIMFTPAMKELAFCYLQGKTFSTSDREKNSLPSEGNKSKLNYSAIGMAWMQAAHSVGGDLDAAHEVALMYEFGKFGVSIDVVEAATWFERAATAGHIEAMAELALCYELGCGVEQSDDKANDWYFRAANCGHLPATYSVGEAYETARGVPQSDEEACLWYYKAAVGGDDDSCIALRRLRDIARIILPRNELVSRLLVLDE